MRHTVPSCAEPTVIGDKSATAAVHCLAGALKYLVIGAIAGASLVTGAEIARRGEIPVRSAAAAVR